MKTEQQVKRVATSLVAHGNGTDDRAIILALGSERTFVRFSRFAQMVRAEVAAMEQEARDIAAILGR